MKVQLIIEKYLIFLAPEPQYGPPIPSYAQPAETKIVKVIEEHVIFISSI